MSKVRLQPHRTADEGAVEFGPWWVWLNGERLLAEDRLKGWDYESETRFEIQPSFDSELLVQSTGVEELARMSIVALVDCAATGRRFTARMTLAQLMDAEDRSLFVELPRGEVAEQVKVSAHLVLTQASRSVDGSASKPGSRLAESRPLTVRLEGDGARFPTEEVSFAAMHLEPAVWTLRCEFEDLHDSFLGNIRLLVNSDHPAASALLDDSVAGADIAQSVLRFDVARQLFLLVAVDREMQIQPDEEFPVGSVGHALASMSSLYLKADLSTIVQLARSNLSAFERRLQAGMDLMRSS